MGNIEQDIYKAIAKNRIITLALCVLCGILIVSFSIGAFAIYRYNMNHALLVNSEGDVLPLKWQNKAEIADISIKNHIKLTMERRFVYDYTNAQDEERQDLMLALFSRKEGKRILKSEGDWYKKVKNRNLIQKIKILPETITYQTSNQVTQYQGSCILTIYDRDNRVEYKLTVKGKINSITPNFPKNPHGYMNYNYSEKRNKLSKS